ncbi:MAG: thiolase family protein [Candidatus Dadabacteria bacterium]|nr:MAG: thiolase family protein [Candidatus Dadabacteria bacterium]
MKKLSKDVYICAAKRTPIGSFGKSLSSFSAPKLCSSLVKPVLEQGFSNFESGKNAVNELIIGCVLQAGVGQAPARQVLVYSGLPLSVQAMTVNKVCSSGLAAVMLGALKIEGKDAEIILAGGMESMSNAPYILHRHRFGAQLGHDSVEDCIITDGLWDIYGDKHMGQCAELCAREYNFSREEQDEFAVLSYTRALKAAREGWFKNEIVPLTVVEKKKEVTVSEDEEPKRFNQEKIPVLKPAFEKEGTVTAANASSINDGAALLLLAGEEGCKRYNLKPLARIVGYSWFGQEPEWFTTAPVGATKKLLEKVGKSIDEVDLFEVNEAFAVVALAYIKELNLSREKVNISGGAVALGHPIGASGARILITLLNNLKRTGGRVGLAAICNGGGEATAMMVEML